MQCLAVDEIGFLTRTPWRNDRNLIVPVLKERKINWNRDSSPTRQFTDTHFEDSSPTELKTVHRQN